MMATEMTGVRQQGYGGPEVLEVVRTPRPEPGDHDVLVKVRAAALNFGDRMTLLGRPWLFRPLAYGMRRPSAPFVGMAAAGVVVAVGRAVTAWAIGDSVLGELSRGACAEYVLARSSELARKPEAVRFEDAAAIPVAGATALQGLRDLGSVQPGQRVLINGASGGVGTFALQIAKALGAHVTAVVRGGHVARASALGADAVVDADQGAWVDTGECYDVVFDLVGNHAFAKRRRALTANGVYVASFGQGGNLWLGPLPGILQVAAASTVSRQIRVLAAQPDPVLLDDVVAMVADGRVMPLIEARYELPDTPRAFGALLAGRRRGKLVISIDNPYPWRQLRS